MSIDDLNVTEAAVEDVATEEPIQEENEELVENENLDEDSSEDLEEGKVKEEDEEEDEEDEVQTESAPSMPKTKAGVIQAAVEIFKKARKEDAQALFAKLTKVTEMDDKEDEDEKDESYDSKKKAKAQVEGVDFEEDLDALIKEEATLSDDFRGKAGSIFEAVLTSKLAQEVDRLEAEYVQNLEEEVSEIQSSLVEKVDSYMNYVVETWMADNEVAVTEGLRTEVAEEFMTSLQKVFTEHYIEVPEGKVDLVDDLSAQVTELEESLNKSTEDNIQLHNSVQEFTRAAIVREQSSGLAETDAEKLSSLVEDIDFDDAATFEMKVKTVKESYFRKEIKESVDEVDSLLGSGTQDVDMSDPMSRYTQAITKFNQ
jgi:hypothetical protein|tara:strand:+ start:4207 stop:5319 length:1113 start_codon:yes stop_codon:yes gene_type:complete